MDFKLKLTNAQKKNLETKYAQALAKSDGHMTRRISGLLSLDHGYSVRDVANILRVCAETVRQWVRNFFAFGVASTKPKLAGGRPPKLTKTQRKQLSESLRNGPEACGFPGACWRTPMIQAMIKRDFGVHFNVRYLAEYMKNLGFSYQRASFVASQRDAESRNAWLSETWPAIYREQQLKGAYLLFGDECSFAQWGSLSKTWAPIGQTPLVQTRGTRKSYKVFGAIDFDSGKFFHQGVDGKLNGGSYIEFLRTIISKTRKPIILIQDGAPYHKSKAVKEFIAKSSDRLSVYSLPSYSPDFNPIEKLWKKIKEGYTHHHYFETYESLVQQVEKACSSMSERLIKPLFGMYRKLTGVSANPAL